MTNSQPSAIIMNEVCSECQREKSIRVCKSLQKSVNEGAEIVHIWNLEKFHEKTHFPHQMQRAII